MTDSGILDGIKKIIDGLKFSNVRYFDDMCIHTGSGIIGINRRLNPNVIFTEEQIEMVKKIAASSYREGWIKCWEEFGKQFDQESE